MTQLIFYRGRDNVEFLTLSEGSDAVDVASITRVVLVSKTVIIDSAEYPGLFDWNATIPAGKNKGSKALMLLLGESSLADGSYSFNLITYDSDNTDGILWGNIRVLMKPANG
jgi:hypothetical protein